LFRASQSSGRGIAVSNGDGFKDPLFNYTPGAAYMLYETSALL